MSIDNAVDREMFPAIGASNYVSLGGNDHRYNAFMSYPALVSLTKNSSKHTVKTGARRAHDPGQRLGGARRRHVQLLRRHDAGTESQHGEHDRRERHRVAAARHRDDHNALIQNWKNVASKNFYFGGYLQDDWRITSRLTLNLGVRYDFETPRTERYERMNYFDPGARSPLADVVPQYPNLSGGLVFVGVDGNSRWQFEPDTNNIAPRVGGAFEIDSKTVLRAGYAQLYGPSYQQANGTVGPFGFRTENIWVSTVDGITPFRLLRDPYPAGFTASPGSSQGLLTGAGGRLEAPLQDGSPTPWTRQWNVTVQRELPWRVAAEVSYVGTAGHNLQTNTESGLNLNQLDPQYLALGSALNQTVPNPFFGIVNSGILVSPTISRAQSLRPYPQFLDIIPLQNTGSTSIYHALQLSVNRRMSGGLALAGSYAWSKAEEEGESHQNSYDIAASRSVASYDIPHRLVVSALYEVPFGRGRKFGTDAAGVARWHRRRLAGQRHRHRAERYAADDHGDQQRRPLQSRHPRQLER